MGRGSQRQPVFVVENWKGFFIPQLMWLEIQDLFFIYLFSLYISPRVCPRERPGVELFFNLIPGLLCSLIDGCCLYTLLSSSSSNKSCSTEFGGGRFKSVPGLAQVCTLPYLTAAAAASKTAAICCGSFNFYVRQSGRPYSLHTTKVK